MKTGKKYALFYTAVLLFIISAVVLHAETRPGGKKGIFGFSGYTVPGGAEIAEGSLLIARKTPDLKAGDDIIFRKDKCTIAAHKITGIEASNGTRNFKTAAISSLYPGGTVAEADVIGKIIFIIPKAGGVISFINGKAALLLAALAVCGIMIRIAAARPQADKRRDETAEYPA